MSTKERFEAAIFDLDGVIADTAKFHFIAWQQLANDLGITLEDAAEAQLKGLERMASLMLILGEHAQQYTEQQLEQLAAKKNEHYRELIQTLTHADLLEGAGQLLDKLATLGVPIALASASKNAAAVIERLGVASYFNYIADANLVANPKPDPEIFLNASAGLAVAPKACVGIEDAAAGVAAINSAGMYSVGVGDAHELSDADEVISSLTQFSVDKYFGS